MVVLTLDNNEQYRLGESLFNPSLIYSSSKSDNGIRKPNPTPYWYDENDKDPSDGVSYPQHDVLAWEQFSWQYTDDVRPLLWNNIALSGNDTNRRRCLFSLRVASCVYIFHNQYTWSSSLCL
jgi:hypothetical protein